MDGDPTGTVDVNDLTIVLANFGTSSGASRHQFRPRALHHFPRCSSPPPACSPSLGESVGHPKAPSLANRISNQPLSRAALFLLDTPLLIHFHQRRTSREFRGRNTELLTERRNSVTRPQNQQRRSPRTNNAVPQNQQRVPRTNNASPEPITRPQTNNASPEPTVIQPRPSLGLRTCHPITQPISGPLDHLFAVISLAW